MVGPLQKNSLSTFYILNVVKAYSETFAENWVQPRASAESNQGVNITSKKLLDYFLCCGSIIYIMSKNNKHNVNESLPTSSKEVMANCVFENHSQILPQNISRIISIICLS